VSFFQCFSSKICLFLEQWEQVQAERAPDGEPPQPPREGFEGLLSHQRNRLPGTFVYFLVTDIT